MKLEPLFTINDNKLYKIADNSQVDLDSIIKIELPWTTVELEPESYNEEYLAKLRDQLKQMEETSRFAIIVPIVDKPINTPEDEELFINACNHTARRIKDCISVVGFEIPVELEDFEAFIDTLCKKHAQYIYFSKGENVHSDVIISY